MGNPKTIKIEAFFRCSICDRFLPAMVVLNASLVPVIKNTRWKINGHGRILCDRCAEVESLVDLEREQAHQDERPRERTAPRKNPAEKDARILEALAAGGTDAAKLARSTGIPRTTVLQRLDALQRRGEVKRAGGVWCIARDALTSNVT